MMLKQWTRRMLALALAGSYFMGMAASPRAAGREVVIFAAASTTNAITEIGELYKKKNLGGIKASFASSSTLAKQIEQGAPADVFLSANTAWMEYLDEKKRIAPGTRSDLLRNRIALIVPKDSAVKSFDIKEGVDILALLGKDGKLAVGDPAHVPVGMYGKQALENLNIWDSVKDRIAPAKDVRAGLVLVERAETPLGLVYASDVAASDKVRIVGVFPANTHPDIVYPVGAVAGNQEEEANTFIQFLFSPEAKEIFKKYGFEGI